MRNLVSPESLAVHDIVLHLKNSILESKEVEIKHRQFPTLTDGLTVGAVKETKVVLISELTDAFVNGEKNDLMEQEKAGSVRTPNRSVRITIETL